MNNFFYDDTTVFNQYLDRANKLKQEILSSPNTQFDIKGQTYYISNSGDDNNNGKTYETPIKTIARLHQIDLQPGDAVCFKRGDIWRELLLTKQGVTYTAYGEGEKPILVRSPENGADKTKWKNVGGNVWEYQTVFDLDVGTLVFNHGEAHTTKWLVYKNADTQMQDYRTKTLWDGPETMTTDLDMWHNNSGHSGTDYKVYIYSEENPGKRFKSIEFLQKENKTLIADKFNKK